MSFNNGLRSPVAYFGGKRLVADEIWARIGDVDNFVDPFCGSASILLGRPTPPKLETINDVSGLLVNTFRGIKYAPDKVAEYAMTPVYESEKHAAHVWLIQAKDSLTAKLEGDLDYFDARAAGLWLYGMACHIGGGWCDGNGAWKPVDGQLLEMGGGSPGLGITRSIPSLTGRGKGTNTVTDIEDMKRWMRSLSERFRNVRITCGDWTRVLGPSATFYNGTTAVVLDPPYGNGFEYVYNEGRADICKEVEEWAIENGKNPLLRIALMGYDGLHEMPPEWTVYKWKAQGGYGGQRQDGTKNENNTKERIWLSPACIEPEHELFKL